MIWRLGVTILPESSLRGSRLERLGACHHIRHASSAGLQGIAFFVLFSVQCIAARSAQENLTASASPTPTPDSGESVQPGLKIHGTISSVVVVGRQDDGPWTPSENFRKLNFVLRYSQGSDNDGFSLMLDGYSGAWTGEQQIPERAVRDHEIGYFGNLDPSDGGNSQRYMFTAEWHGRPTENSYTTALFYCYYYDLDLFSDFIYFLDNPVLGDQFEQKDQRIVSGLTIDHRSVRVTVTARF
jgi:hypothetical protein